MNTDEHGWGIGRRRAGSGRPVFEFIPVPALICVLCLCFATVWSEAAQKKTPPKQPLDLNTARIEELQRLPGIGPTTAKAIVRFREKSGPFRRVEDLLAVPRVTRRLLEKIRPYVAVGEAKSSRSPGDQKRGSREACMRERGGHHVQDRSTK